MPQRRYLLSAVTNWLAFAATLLVAFFLSPYLIHKLGDGQYGVWVFVESILAYFTLFDLGIAACVVRFTAKFHTSKDQTQLNKLVSSCGALFLGLGLLSFVLGFALTPVLAPLFSKSGMADTEVAGFMLLMLGNLALSLPLSIFPSLLDGLERFAAKSAIRIVFLALRTAAIIVLMEHQPSLMGLAVLFTISNFLEHAALAALSVRYLPRLRFRYSLVDRATLKLVKGYSLDAFLAMIAGRVSVQSGAIIIGIFLSAPEITWFAIALRLVEFAKALLRSATTTLTPAISSLESAGDIAAIRRVLFHATRWVLYLIVPVHLGLIIFGRPFLKIWLGSDEYAQHCYPALVILSATLSLVVAQSVASRILYGMGRLRLFARMALLEALLNIVLSLVLVNKAGIVGIAWAVAIPNLLFCCWVIGYACRTLQVPVGEYLRATWARPLLAGLVPLAIWSIGWGIAGWGTLGIAIAAGLAPYSLMILIFEQRSRLLFAIKRPVVARSVLPVVSR